MTLTAAQQTEIAKPVRSPRGLVKIIHASGTIRIATGGNVTWDSQSWVKGGVEIKNVKTGKGGVQSVRITLINEDQIYSELAILGSFKYKEVFYWEYYGSSPALEDPILRFHGEIVKIPTMSNKIVFDCSTVGASTKRIPNLTLGSPHVNHMPRNGEKITIGNETFTIEIN